MFFVNDVEILNYPYFRKQIIYIGYLLLWRHYRVCGETT